MGDDINIYQRRAFWRLKMEEEEEEETKKENEWT